MAAFILVQLCVGVSDMCVTNSASIYSELVYRKEFD